MISVKFYFIKKDKFFDRQNLYEGPQGDYADNNLSFGFFSKAVLALLKKIDFKADILHLHDYHSAMCAFFLAQEKQRQDGFFQDTKSVFTIHNLAYQGIYDENTLDMLGIDRKYFHMDSLEFYGKINYMKGGIVYSDKITTVSPTYAREISQKNSDQMLDGILLARKDEILAASSTG
jgi:starch synthase